MSDEVNEVVDGGTGSSEGDTPTPSPPSPTISDNDSILTSVKKLIGLDENYTRFDVDICLLINSCFSYLAQIGVGSNNTAYQISGKTETWNDFVTFAPNVKSLGFIKSFIPLKVRIIFDPPTNSFLVDAIKKEIDELESRINMANDTEGMEDD